MLCNGFLLCAVVLRAVAAVRCHSHNPTFAAHPGGLWHVLFPDDEPEVSRQHRPEPKLQSCRCVPVQSANLHNAAHETVALWDGQLSLYIKSPKFPSSQAEAATSTSVSVRCCE